MSNTMCVKRILRKVIHCNITSTYHGHSAPSTSAETTSGHLLHSIIEFPLISVTERRLKSWLVGSLSSHPFFLARACPMRLTTPVATLWKPPRVSTARGKNCSPWVLQASAVSLVSYHRLFQESCQLQLPRLPHKLGREGWQQ